jgi:hypothetical protein
MNRKPLVFSQSGLDEGRLDLRKVRRPNTPPCLLRMKAASGRAARFFLRSHPDQFFIDVLPISLQNSILLGMNWVSMAIMAVIIRL